VKSFAACGLAVQVNLLIGALEAVIYIKPGPAEDVKRRLTAVAKHARWSIRSPVRQRLESAL
jgi:hypothetical protein